MNMKRISRKAAGVLSLAQGLSIPLLLLMAAVVIIDAAVPRAARSADPLVLGIYTRVPDFKSSFNGQQVEVMEFFSFYCGHCYEFEKYIPVIRGNFPKKVTWKNVPIYWGNGSPKPGEAYMLAEEMGKGEQMKKAIFDALFLEKKDIGNIDVLESIGTKLGLGFDFSRRLRAGDKAKEANAALIMSKAYAVDETPSMVIAGNLKVSPSMVNHNINVFRDNAIVIIKSLLGK